MSYTNKGKRIKAGEQELFQVNQQKYILVGSVKTPFRKCAFDFAKNVTSC